MYRLLALVGYGLVLWVAGSYAYSVSGALVTGLGTVLLLDRHAFRLLPWSPVDRGRELRVRAGYFLIGAAFYFWMRPGIVPLWEAAYRGLVVCLAGLLLDGLVALARHLWPGRHAGWWCRGVTVAGVGLCVPVIGALHPVHTVPKRTPAALGLAFEDVRFAAADGVVLAGWLVPHPEARGNVIFCHGQGRNRGHAAGLLRTLHDLRLNVLAFDFRGHGDSGGHTSTFGHREVDDLCAAAAYLEARSPGRPLLLVGVSLGAAVSLQALPRLPQTRGVWSEGAFARLAHPVDRTLAAVPRTLRRPLEGLYYRLAWLDCGLWAPAVNPIDGLDGSTVPVLFCHGVRDRLVPLEDGQALHDAYPGPKGHWWVAGASHYDVRQRNHEEYLARLRAFLSDCLAAGEFDDRQVASSAGAP